MRNGLPLPTIAMILFSLFILPGHAKATPLASTTPGDYPLTYRFESPLAVRDGTKGQLFVIPGLPQSVVPEKPVLPYRMARILLPPGTRLSGIKAERLEEKSLASGIYPPALSFHSIQYYHQSNFPGRIKSASLDG